MMAPPGSRFGAVGRHDALEHVLLGNGSQHHGDGRGDEKHHILEAGLGKEVEHVAAHRQRHHLVGPTGHVAGKHGQDAQTGDQDDHLDEIGQCHRPHASEQGVGQDRHHADHHAHRDADGPTRQQVEHQAQGRDLGRNPAQVTQHDDERADDLHTASITLAEKVADGQQGHAVELGREEQPHQDQAGSGAKGVFDYAAQSAVDEFGRDTQHHLRAKPGGEGGGDDHDQRQPAPGDGEVRRVLDALGSVQADGNGHQQVNNDEGQQHLVSP